MCKKTGFLVVIFILFAITHGYSQNKMISQVHAYGKKNASPALFVHYDKNIYTNNEMVWFTAYGLESVPADSIASIFVVALIRNIDSTVVLQNKFIYQDGFSFGSFTLPDTVLTGDYQLVAYTNEFVNNRPRSSFVQPITIKTTKPLAINLSVKNLGDPADFEKTKILISATDKNNSFLPKPATVFYAYNGKVTKKPTDLTGQLMFDLLLAADSKDPNLDIKVKFGKDSGFVRLPLKVKPRKAAVKFYPEGGNMVNNIPTTVGFEIKDIYGTPIETKAILFKNNKVLDTVGTTSYGIGSFYLKPEKGDKYTLKVMHSEVADSTFYLPAATEDGVVITLNKALAVDTLRLILRTTSPRTVYLTVHNFKETYAMSTLKLRRTQPVAIPLTGMPAGLATITVTDSAGRPLAERMAFLHFKNDRQLILHTDTTVYNKRQKVDLNIKLTDTTAAGVVSIACVQDNRLDINKLTNIRQYTFLEQEIAGLSIPAMGNKLGDPEYLEHVLLVKGWTRYSWKDAMAHNVADSLQQITNLALQGSILRNNKELKQSVNVNVLRGAEFGVIPTKNNGTFSLSVADMAVPYGKKVLMLVNGKDKDLYEVNLDDPFSTFNKTLPSHYHTQTNSHSDLKDNTIFAIPKNEKSLQIQAVDIVKTQDNSLFGTAHGPNACGDWVCINGYLNCFNHDAYYPGSKKPVEGATYNKFSGSGSIKFQYLKCEVEETKTRLFEGVNIAKEFYNTNHSDLNEPAFFSTLLWKHAVAIEPNKTANIQFDTGDITGKFRIIVQGISDKDVVFEQGFFEVKAKP